MKLAARLILIAVALSSMVVIVTAIRNASTHACCPGVTRFYGFNWGSVPLNYPVHDIFGVLVRVQDLLERKHRNEPAVLSVQIDSSICRHSLAHLSARQYRDVRYVRLIGLTVSRRDAAVLNQLPELVQLQLIDCQVADEFADTWRSDIEVLFEARPIPGFQHDRDGNLLSSDPLWGTDP